MTDAIHRLEQEVPLKPEQADGRREAEQRIQTARELPEYRYETDGSYHRDFTDRQGRVMKLEVEGDDQASTQRAENTPTQESNQFVRIRAYDTSVTGSQPAFRGQGEAGYANATVEIRREGTGYERIAGVRLRLADIKTHPHYEGNGIGDQMLGEVERVGREHGAAEVYGNFVPEAGKEAVTRQWYEHRGYEFRPKPGGGEEVYKTLAESDAERIRHELRG